MVQLVETPAEDAMAKPQSGNTPLSRADVRKVLGDLTRIVRSCHGVPSFRGQQDWLKEARKLYGTFIGLVPEDFDKILKILGEGSSEMKLHEESSSDQDATALLVHVTNEKERFIKSAPLQSKTP